MTTTQKPAPTTCTIRRINPPAGTLNQPTTYQLDGDTWRLKNAGSVYLDGAMSLAPKALRRAQWQVKQFGPSAFIFVDEEDYRFCFEGGEFSGPTK